MLSLLVDPSIPPSLVVGVEVAHYQRIFRSRNHVEERTVNVKRGISIGMSIKIDNYYRGI